MNERWEVFISYAAGDPAWPANVVAEVAGSLRQRGIWVQLDLDYRQERGYKPSDDEWREWMSERLKSASRVLCLASPRYREAVERKQSVRSGYGVAFESAQIIAKLYRDKGRNEGRVFAIVPDQMQSAEVLPVELDWGLSKYSWPREREDLLADLAGLRQRDLQRGTETAGASAPADGPEPIPHPLNHRQLVDHRLRAAPVFWQAFRADNFEDAAVPQDKLVSTEAFVAWLDGATAELGEAVMFAARRALLAVRRKSAAPEVGAAAESAAVALYLLAASRWIEPTQPSAAFGFVVPVPGAEPLYCALITVRLAGGVLELQPSEKTALPRAEFAFRLNLPFGETTVDQFERALYMAAYRLNAAAVDAAQDDGPLSPGQREQLMAWVRTRTRVDRKTFAFVLTGASPRAVNDAASASALAAALKGRVFVHDPELARALTGVDPQRLNAEIREFWNELRHYPNGHPA